MRCAGEAHRRGHPRAPIFHGPRLQEAQGDGAADQAGGEEPPRHLQFRRLQRRGGAVRDLPRAAPGRERPEPLRLPRLRLPTRPRGEEALRDGGAELRRGYRAGLRERGEVVRGGRGQRRQRGRRLRARVRRERRRRRRVCLQQRYWTDDGAPDTVPVIERRRVSSGPCLVSHVRITAPARLAGEAAGTGRPDAGGRPGGERRPVRRALGPRAATGLRRGDGSEASAAATTHPHRWRMGPTCGYSCLPGKQLHGAAAARLHTPKRCGEAASRISTEWVHIPAN
mmetsp:Transcript_7328/g.20575  ORF Transcript_7328/g.20575 Transcript_7328/m.20575 type:complete len:283 (+) Transcript_7328:1168-2016(+)